MNLNIVYVFQTYTVLNGYGKAITCKVSEICGVGKKSSYSSCSHYGNTGLNLEQRAVFLTDNGTVAGVVFLNDIYHCGIFQQLNIWKLTDLFQEMAGYFLSCNVLMVQNSLM